MAACQECGKQTKELFNLPLKGVEKWFCSDCKHFAVPKAKEVRNIKNSRFGGLYE